MPPFCTSTCQPVGPRFVLYPDLTISVPVLSSTALNSTAVLIHTLVLFLHTCTHCVSEKITQLCGLVLFQIHQLYQPDPQCYKVIEPLAFFPIPNIHGCLKPLGIPACLLRCPPLCDTLTEAVGPELLVPCTFSSLSDCN